MARLLGYASPARSIRITCRVLRLRGLQVRDSGPRQTSDLEFLDGSVLRFHLWTQMQVPANDRQCAQGNCIYCKEARRLTREDVMPRALGGNARDFLVCTDCRFPQLDQALAEQSLLSMDRAGRTPVGAFKVGIGGDLFVHDPDQDLYLEACLQNGFTVAPLPQLHFQDHDGDYQPYLWVPDQQGRSKLVAFVDDRIEQGRLTALHVKVGPEERCATPRIAVHRSRDGFIRAVSKDVASSILARVARTWHGGLRDAVIEGTMTTSVTEQPRLEMRRSIRIDDEYRAVAKIAFNAMAMQYGREFALREEFDPIRNYIRGIDVRHPQNLRPNEIAVDHRFVEKSRRDSEPWLPSSGHVIVFEELPRGLAAWITLYSSHSYLVQFGQVRSPRLTPWFWEFSVDRSGNRILDPIEVYRRRLARDVGAT